MSCRIIDRERERQRERSSTHWFTPQMASVAGARLIGSQEPGASSRSPTRVQGPKDLDHLPLLSQAMAESWMGRGAARTRTWCAGTARRRISLLSRGTGPNFFFLRFIYLFESQSYTQRKRDRERERGLPSTGSLSRWLQRLKLC